VGSTVDITEQRQLQQQNAAERGLLEMLASDVPLQDIMSEFILRYEAVFTGVTGSVLLMDEEGKHLKHGAAPSLPARATARRLTGIAIGATCWLLWYRGIHRQGSPCLGHRQ